MAQPDRTWNKPGMIGAGFDSPLDGCVEVELYLTPPDSRPYGLARVSTEPATDAAAVVLGVDPEEYARRWFADIEATENRATQWAFRQGFTYAEDDEEQPLELEGASAPDGTPWTVFALVPSPA